METNERMYLTEQSLRLFAVCIVHSIIKYDVMNNVLGLSVYDVGENPRMAIKATDNIKTNGITIDFLPILIIERETAIRHTNIKHDINKI